MCTLNDSEYKLDDVDKILIPNNSSSPPHCISRYFHNTGYREEVNLKIIVNKNYTEDEESNNDSEFAEAIEEIVSSSVNNESYNQNSSQDSGIVMQTSQEFMDKSQNSQTNEDDEEDREFRPSQLNDDGERIVVQPFFNISPREMPKSPHNVIEEEFKNNPWVMLVATIFLTKTSGKVARPFMKKFFYHFPTPLNVLDSEPSKLEEYFETLGLRKRGTMIWKMSYQFISGKWRRASDLCGIGKYGEDAYRLFCLGHCDIEPTDRYLRLYLDWLKSQTDHAKSWSIVDCERVIIDPVEKYYRISLR